MDKHHRGSDKKDVLQQLFYCRKNISANPDSSLRQCNHSQKRYEGVDGLSMFFFSSAALLLSGEVHEKLIELDPWDNTCFIVSSSIKCCREISEGVGGVEDNMFGSRANAAHWRVGGQAITSKNGSKGGPPKNQ